MELQAPRARLELRVRRPILAPPEELVERVEPGLLVKRPILDPREELEPLDSPEKLEPLDRQLTLVLLVQVKLGLQARQALQALQAQARLGPSSMQLKWSFPPILLWLILASDSSGSTMQISRSPPRSP